MGTQTIHIGNWHMVGLGVSAALLAQKGRLHPASCGCMPSGPILINFCFDCEQHTREES